MMEQSKNSITNSPKSQLLSPVVEASLSPGSIKKHGEPRGPTNFFTSDPMSPKNIKINSLNPDKLIKRSPEKRNEKDAGFTLNL